MTTAGEPTRAARQSRAFAFGEPHPTEAHLYRLGDAELYLADTRAILDELDAETPDERARRHAAEDARHARSTQAS